MAATLHDVAAEAGVSFKTVSNVVNEYPHVREATRQKVLAAIDRLGYRPNLQARSLRLGRTGVIGLAVPELGLTYFAELTSEVIAAAERRGLVVLTEQTNRSRTREIEAVTGSRRRMTDGLILSPLAMEEADVADLRAAGPLVLLGEAFFPEGVDHISMQNVAAARAATAHLLRRGHRRIAAIGAHLDEQTGSAALRLQGYRAEIERAGLPWDPSLIGEASLWHRLEGAEAMRQVLARGPVDAVFAFNDTLALGAVHAIQTAGLRVPEDISVIGFDNIEEGSYSFPELTTIDPGRREIAELAVATMVERIADPEADGRRVEVAFHVVERGSVRDRSVT